MKTAGQSGSVTPTGAWKTRCNCSACSASRRTPSSRRCPNLFGPTRATTLKNGDVTLDDWLTVYEVHIPEHVDYMQQKLRRMARHAMTSFQRVAGDHSFVQEIAIALYCRQQLRLALLVAFRRALARDWPEAPLAAVPPHRRNAMQFGLLYECQRPFEGTEIDWNALYKETLEQCELADQVGFDNLWFVEHHFLTGFSGSPSQDAIFGALSRITKQIRIGYGVCILPYHHPVRVAERVALLDQLTDGRIEVGTGRSNAYEQTGLGVDPAGHPRPLERIDQHAAQDLDVRRVRVRG